MKLKVLVMGIAMVVTTPLAIAEGFYGAFDLGQSKAKDACKGVAGLCSYTDTAYRLAAGYQINQNFGVEGAYVDLGKTNASVAGNAVNIKNTEWQVAATGTYPFGNGFSLIGKAGIAFWDQATSVAVAGGNPNGKNILLGIGAQYDLSKVTAVRGQYETHQTGDNVTGRGDLATLSVGVVFKF